MADLNTGGFQLQALPQAPQAPQNLGKIDVQGVYQAALDALNAGNQGYTGYGQIAAENARNQGVVQQTPIQTGILQNQLAGSAGQAQQALAGGARALGTLDTGIFANNAENLGAGAQAASTIPGSVAATNAGNAFLGEQGDLLAAAKNAQDSELNDIKTQGYSFKQVPGGGIFTQLDVSNPQNPHLSRSFVSQPALYNTQVKNSDTLGAVLNSTDGIHDTYDTFSGNPYTGALAPSKQEVVPHGAAPSVPVYQSAQHFINSITQSRPGGVLGQPQAQAGAAQTLGGALAQAPAAAAPTQGGVPAQAAPAQGGALAPQATQPAAPVVPASRMVLNADARKEADEVHQQIIAGAQNIAAIDNIQKHAADYAAQGAGFDPLLGKFPQLSAFFGNDKAQELIGSDAQALQQALAPLKGTGRVAVQEFNFALNALPKPTDTLPTIQSKMSYIANLANWSQQWKQSYYQGIIQTGDKIKAEQLADASNPPPAHPDFDSLLAKSAAGTPPAAAPAVAPTGPKTITLKAPSGKTLAVADTPENRQLAAQRGLTIQP